MNIRIPINVSSCTFKMKFKFQLLYTLLMEQSKIADDKEYFTSSWRGIG